VTRPVLGRCGARCTWPHTYAIDDLVWVCPGPGWAERLNRTLHGWTRRKAPAICRILGCVPGPTTFSAYINGLRIVHAGPPCCTRCSLPLPRRARR
jgi:hypothetical protein